MSAKEHTLPFAFFGTPAVASETLRALIKRGFSPAVVVTSPDAPKGRGLVLTPSPVKSLALEHGISVLAPESLDEAFIARLQEYNCAYGVAVAYGKIFPEALLAAFPQGVLNVHYSLLPKYRGATPLEAALLAGDNVTGVTIQKMVKEMDAGDILAQGELAIAPDETARELRPKLIRMGAELLVETLPAFEQNELTASPQDASRASRARKLKKADGELDLSAPARDNWLKYRAYADTIGTFFFTSGKRVKITQASFDGSHFVIERVTPEGKKEMDYASFTKA